MPPIIPYASRTGTRKNLAALRTRLWRLLISAMGVLRHEGFQYCLDNGAWTAHQKGLAFDEARFDKALVKMGPGSDFTICPDIVGGGRESLAFSLKWLDRVLEYAPIALIPVQDGMELADVEHLLSPRVGIFVGGSPDTNFKERTTPLWATACRRAGAWCHVGRVNSQRRIAICKSAGATSFDGTSATKYSVELPKLNRAVVQQSLVFDHPDKEN